MSATIEERLARYTTRLDEAVSEYSAGATRPAPHLLSGPARPGGRGRRLVAAGVVAGVVAVAGFAIATSRSNHDVNVSTVSSVPRIGPASTSPTSTTTAPSTTAPTTTVPNHLPPPPFTQQVTYQPFTANGIDPALHVTQRLSGTCIHDHEGTRDYYRCFANPSSAIYDPCFAGPHGAADPLVCPRNPATVDVVELTATSVTSDPPSSLTRPWAMQLSNGQVCQFVEAAWGGLGPYGCASTGGAQPVSDCREPVAAQPWWTTDCQDQLTDASPFVATRVVKVWY
jgi:hypothetical protein